MLTYDCPFEDNLVLTTEFEWLKPNRDFSELLIQFVTVLMVTKLPFRVKLSKFSVVC